MILHVYSNRSYLSINKSRSWAGGYYFLSSNDSDLNKATKNGAIHVLYKILQNVMASAVDIEIAWSFENAKEVILMRNALVFLDYLQPPTLLQVDNTTAVNFAKNELKQKRSKAIDMWFYSLQDRSAQEQFKIYWKRSLNNYADYFTKHFFTTIHIAKRSTYLHEPWLFFLYLFIYFFI